MHEAIFVVKHAHIYMHIKYCIRLTVQYTKPICPLNHPAVLSHVYLLSDLKHIEMQSNR